MLIVLDPSKLGASIQALTQMILYVGWLRVTESYDISDKYVSHLSNLMRDKNSLA